MSLKAPSVLLGWLCLAVAVLFFFVPWAAHPEKNLDGSQQEKLNEALVAAVNQNIQTQLAIVAYCKTNSELAEQNADLLRTNAELTEAIQEAISYIQAQQRTLDEKPKPPSA